MTSSQLFPKIDTVVIRVRDLEQAKNWYMEKLGLPVIYLQEDQKLVVFGCGGETSLTLWELQPGETILRGSTAGSYPIFFSNDIETAHQALSQQGVKVGPIQADSGQVKWFQFSDCDGNTLEVCQY